MSDSVEFTECPICGDIIPENELSSRNVCQACDIKYDKAER